MKNSFNYSKISIYSMIKNNVSDYGDRTSFINNLNKTKYDSFIQKIDEYALSFYNMGINKGDVVTLILPNSIDTFVCIYALNKIGAISNIMHHLSSEEEINNSINETSSHYIITYEDKLKSIENITSKECIYNVIYLSINDIVSPFDKIKNIFKKSIILPSKFISFYRLRIMGKHNKKNVKVCDKEDNLAIIISNHSKKIYLTNKNINSYAINYSYNNDILTQKNRYLCDSSIINSIPLIHRTLIYGQTVIINSSEDINKFVDNIIKFRPNILEISSNTLEYICSNKKVNKEDLSYLKLIICGSSLLRDNVYQKAKLFLKNHYSNSKVVASFGMLESTSNITINDNLDDKIESAGLPIKGTSIKIINPDTKKECKPNEEGLICISGPTICRNDYNNLICSDDIGYLDEDGYLYYKSSMKRIIVSNGNKIYPEDIENIVKKHEYVKDASIVGVPHPYKKEVVKLYIVLKDKLILNSEIKKSIKEYCEKNISKYALPYAYAYRKELPKTNVGKIAYEELVNLKEE
ncbi:MAG: acyl--CoA ligase [Bacilli bacterium]|nr:acyl--CoA ligase [Bacilli bacterium]